MKMDEIRTIARQWNLKTGNLKKADLVRSIQAAEGNTACFGTPARENCRQSDCLWREDCLTEK
jgi:hypothetical protein